MFKSEGNGVFPQKILKRNGVEENWDSDKIALAVRKAFLACNTPNFLLAKKIAREVQINLSDKEVVSQEDVQDLVEKSLMKSCYYNVAKKYILYREQRRQIREQGVFLDISKTIGQLPLPKGRGLSKAGPGADQHSARAKRLSGYVRDEQDKGALYIYHSDIFYLQGTWLFVWRTF